MAKKPGPKPKLGKSMRATKTFRIPEETRDSIDRSGTVDFWRPVLEKVSEYKMLLDDGQITPEEFEERIGRELKNVAVEYQLTTAEQLQLWLEKPPEQETRKDAQT